MSEMRGKESPECGRMYIFKHRKPKSFQGPNAGPGALAAYGWLCSHDLALLHWQFLALEGIVIFKKSESFVMETCIFCHVPT